MKYIDTVLLIMIWMQLGGVNTIVRWWKKRTISGRVGKDYM